MKRKIKHKKKEKREMVHKTTRHATRHEKNSPIAKIKVVGVGGGGGNAVTRMSQVFPRGVELIAINTDIQDLEQCHARKKLYIGKQITRGLGAGMNPELGRAAAEENREEIAQALSGADIIFLTAGFGGGTGSGATPVVAEIAQELGILTVAIVTKPFSFEGVHRAQIAQDAIVKLKDRVDTAPTSYISPETYDTLTVIKGPQTVLWGPGASAGTILFDREPESFGELGTRVNASVLAGSNGRFDKLVDAAAGGPLGYVRVIGNTAHSDDYKDGNNDTVPSRYDKWNGDVAVGWTPSADTLLELTAGKGDGEARYAGRGMDGSQFLRESLGLRFEKSNIGEVLSKVEAQVYYNYADHVMDNYSLRVP